MGEKETETKDKNPIMTSIRRWLQKMDSIRKYFPEIFSFGNFFNFQENISKNRRFDVCR